MALINPLSNAFGLDIGDRTFKVARLSRGRRDGQPFKITAWHSIDVPEGVMDKGEIKDMDAAVAKLTQLLKTPRGAVRSRAVVACLPEAKTFIKIIELEANPTAEAVEQAVAKEIEQNIPLPVSEIYYDWQVLGAQMPAAKPVIKKKRKAKKGEPEPAEEPLPPAEPAKVLLGAAPKTLVDDYTTLLERAGLMPVALEIEATAISRAIVPRNGTLGEAVGILDIGGTRSSLIIYDGGVLQMSISIPISGLAITKAISESLNLSADDAEKLKRECGLDESRCEDKIWNILLPLIDDMTEKLRNALRFYKIGFPNGKEIERLYLCGGGAQFREIDSVLSRKLTIKVLRGDALANVDPRVPKGFPRREDALSYTTAIGLAMRAAEEKPFAKKS